ncbi:hypothetical protein H2200_009218 [Cladophialophora chaetospira]|uniref:SWR1-complex protein 3 domain-containing protein n=1 Tax=Cladophialophora chaetospira TaxID=386627 RepID=A0AA38X3P5_9EURO|nr:hypothetical protein H2200_009218 [Cladophialophora chaetospira]
MADTTPQKRTLPARERRESAAKRRASSPAQPLSTSLTPAPRKPAAPTSTSTSTPATGRKTPYVRGPYRKRTSLVQIQTPISGSRSSPSASIPGDVLPTRMIADKPLPTTKEKQLTNLSLKEYQSIADSALLSASLLHSRMRWLHNGIFEKYWVKPVKRKGVEPPPNNPDIKSMARLGTATITIEPHTFDVVFYVVRDTIAPPPFPRHPNQHTTKQMIPPSHPPPYTGYPPQAPYQQPRPLPNPHSASTAPNSNSLNTSNPLTPAPSVPTQIPSVPSSPANVDSPAVPVKQESTVRPISTAPSPVQTPSAPSAPQSPPKPTPAPAKGSTQDPVIQMLAARAASDPQLKELMKIVATSRASAEQLKEFQSHIDEFNEVIRRQEAERGAKSEVTAPVRPPTQVVTTPSQPLVPAATQSAAPNPATAVPQPASSSATVPTSVPPQSQPRQPSVNTTVSASLAPGTLPGVVHAVPKPPAPTNRGVSMAGYVGYPHPPPPRPEPLIKHVIMELTSVPSGSYSACPDRWMFPEYAVLEMRPNGLEMLCSFLVECRGSQLVSAAGSEATAETGETEGKWKADQEYYQPVTMTIKTRDHKVIQTIAKAAKTLPVVQEHMKEVMSKKQRAPVEYLVHQLPRERSHANSTETGFVDSGVELNNDSASEDDELKDFYG